jgi:hypothetical protein
MPSRGFPEMAKLWRGFEARKGSIAELSDEQIASRHDRHTAPFYGRPKLVGGVLFATGAAAALAMQVVGIGGSAALTSAGSAVGVALLLGFAVTGIQRYCSFPMARLMEDSLASMLSVVDYRKQHERSERTQDVRQKLEVLGASDAWDNPEYRMVYRRLLPKQPASPWVAEQPRTTEQIVQVTLRDYLGSKDPVRRKFVEGRYTKDLINGKRSVTTYVSRFKTALELSREGLLPAAEGVAILTVLRDEFLSPQTEGYARLQQTLTSLGSSRPIGSGEFEARIWQRDPWVDLTHQEEFYSSASLRGVKSIGRDSKGRLGTFGYLTNPSISALDFSNHRGRQVRVRLGAATAVREGGEPVAVLFVDGVEGSNSVPTEVVRQGVEDYARTGNFAAVVYNSRTHNQNPKRFVAALAKAGVPERAVQICYLDHGRREYLDAFGIPIQPFEYCRPSGVVVARVVQLDPLRPVQARQLSLPDRVRTFLRMNSLGLLVGGSLSFAGFTVWQSGEPLLLPLAGLAAVGIGLNSWFQGRSQRTLAADEPRPGQKGN